jgi:hypothetical protein
MESVTYDPFLSEERSLMAPVKRLFERVPGYPDSREEITTGGIYAEHSEYLKWVGVTLRAR